MPANPGVELWAPSPAQFLPVCRRHDNNRLSLSTVSQPQSNGFYFFIRVATVVVSHHGNRILTNYIWSSQEENKTIIHDLCIIDQLQILQISI